jgi:hypothetical protein
LRGNNVYAGVLKMKKAGFHQTPALQIFTGSTILNAKNGKVLFSLLC